MTATAIEAFCRRALLAILAFGFVGTEVELFLLKHTDGVFQWVPLVLLALGLIVTAWCAWQPGTAAIHAMRTLMVVFILSGGVGVVQHFRGNVDYARDSNPSLSGMALYREAIVGSTPALAPGTMMQFGLLGLLFTFRHPATRRPARQGTASTEDSPR